MLRTDSSWYGGNIPDIDLARATLKDTLVVPARGYAVIRFVVDNPGLWFLHCHQVWHVNAIGMGILLNDSYAHQPPPPRGFPTCSDFEQMADEPETSTSTSTSTSTAAPVSTDTNSLCQSTKECDEDKMFTREEFWGTAGGLLVVVLVQFIITTYSLSKRGNKYAM